MSAVAVSIRRFSYTPAGGGRAHDALVDVVFRIGRGEFVALLGPSGCGKTSLLRAIAGLQDVTDGQVTVGGLPPRAAPPPGMAFQAPSLLPWLTVLRNLELVADGRAHAGQAEALLAWVGLGEWLHAWPNRLSGGMQRRAAFARALMNRPSLLLLDEPFLSVDAPTAERLRDGLLEAWRQHGHTVIMTTHDVDEALRLADRLLLLSAAPGRLIADIPITLPRPRTPGGAGFEDLRRRVDADMAQLGSAGRPAGATAVDVQC